MDRRSLIGTALSLGCGATLSGCLSSLSDDTETTDDVPSGDEGSNESPSSPTAQAIDIGAYQSEVTTSAGPLSFDVSISESTFSDEHPAEIRISIENRTETSIHLSSGHRRIFSTHRDDDEILYLLSPGKSLQDQAPEIGCPMQIDRVSIPADRISVKFSSGRSESQRLEVWADFDALDGVCPTIGVHEFTETYLLEREAGTELVEWGFEIELVAE